MQRASGALHALVLQLCLQLFFKASVYNLGL
jgi:hypothetical protein